MPDEVVYAVLFLLQLFDVVRLQCPAQLVHFDTVRPTTKTPEFCAVTNAGVTQANNKWLTDCSGECAANDDCVAFNYKEPELLCEFFQSPFSNLSLTAGCTYYQVSLK